MLPVRRPLSLRRSRWWACDAFEECLPPPQAGPVDRRERKQQVCHIGRRAWPCPRLSKLGSSLSRRVLFRSSLLLSSCPHLQSRALRPVSSRTQDTLRLEESPLPFASLHTSSSSCRPRF